MNFRVHRIAVPVTPDWVVPRPFVHDVFNFQLTYEKIMSLYDVTAGYLKLAEFCFAHMALDRETMVIDLVDENGNVWNCSLQFSETPYADFKIGGGWERLVQARRIKEGACVVVGAPGVGMNLTLFFCVIRR
ncbi:transmembrane protein, putative [Medicago truncatula]|uniref:Transmembrane protein, putative n=1 Tax=Medicago truncatula TaxID=3880 RepID=G7I3L8_MEDTR|nr:transmembrane protein, putative [Medicago truncatula]